MIVKLLAFALFFFNLYECEIREFDYALAFCQINKIMDRFKGYTEYGSLISFPKDLNKFTSALRSLYNIGDEFLKVESLLSFIISEPCNIVNIRKIHSHFENDYVDIVNLDNNPLPNIVTKFYELNWKFVDKIPAEVLDLFELMIVSHINIFNLINDKYQGVYQATYDPFYPYQILEAMDYMIEFYNLTFELDGARLLARICKFLISKNIKSSFVENDCKKEKYEIIYVVGRPQDVKVNKYWKIICDDEYFEPIHGIKKSIGIKSRIVSSGIEKEHIASISKIFESIEQIFRINLCNNAVVMHLAAIKIFGTLKKYDYSIDPIVSIFTADLSFFSMLSASQLEQLDTMYTNLIKIFTIMTEALNEDISLPNFNGFEKSHVLYKVKRANIRMTHFYKNFKLNRHQDKEFMCNFLDSLKTHSTYFDKLCSKEEKIVD